MSKKKKKKRTDKSKSAAYKQKEAYYNSVFADYKKSSVKDIDQIALKVFGSKYFTIRSFD